MTRLASLALTWSLTDRPGGCVLTLDYLLLVKLDAPRRFRESLPRGRCFLTNLLPPILGRTRGRTDGGEHTKHDSTQP